MSGKLFPLLIITVVLIAGCTTTVQKDQPADTMGSVVVSSTPAGAEVYLDNVYRGTTPLTIPDLPPGTHTLEIRLRDYQPWLKSIVIEQGQKISADISLAPVPVTTSTPAPVPTTRSRTVPTTRPRPIAETTEPTAKTPVGCWKYETTAESIRYELDSDGTGWMSGAASDPERNGTLSPLAITWSFDPDSARVTVREESYSRDPNQPIRWEWEYTYDAYADILATEKGQQPILFRRVSCS